MEKQSENINSNRDYLISFFSKKRSEEELKDIRHLIALYYSEKLTKRIDKIWDERGWTNETMEQFLKTHIRTPYDSKNENKNIDLNSMVSDFFEKYKSSK